MMSAYAGAMIILHINNVGKPIHKSHVDNAHRGLSTKRKQLGGHDEQKQQN